MLSPERYFATLKEGSAVILRLAQRNLNKRIETCPGWTAADLVSHVGTAWAWSAAVVECGSRAEIPKAPGTLGTDVLLGWATDQAGHLIEALMASDLGSDCWTFGLPRSRMFWLRRQALESAVHAWDLRKAVGLRATLVPDLAEDGVDEFLEVMLPRQIRPGDGWTGTSLHLHCEDTVAEWTVRLGPEGAVTNVGPHVDADLHLCGSAEMLYLWCLNRVPATSLKMRGDSATADRWTASILF